MTGSPNPRGTYLQIAEKLRASVESGAVPSEAVVQREHGISRSTVRRAFRVLEAEDLVHPVQGVGWQPGPPGPTPEGRVRALLADMEDGAPFPSELALCQRVGASRPTVRRILAQFEGEGLLVTIPGKGRRVQRKEGVSDGTESH